MRNDMTLLDEGENIVFILNGRRVCAIPVEVAKQMIVILKQKIAKIEELQNVAQIVRDQAIMQRSGLPFGITNNPKLQEEAKKMGEWDRELRRSIPLRGIEPQAVVGTPSLRRS